MTQRRSIAGFTLFEMLLALVIIAIIVGGIRIGLHMVRAAAISGAVTDFSKTNLAVTTFRSKYGGLPGDLSASRAIEFELSRSGDDNAAALPGLRDGNNLIEGGAEGSVALAGETALFWKDLSTTGLIGGDYTAIGTAVGPATAVTSSNVHHYLPPSNLGGHASIYVYSANNQHYYYLGAINAAIATGAIATAPAVTAFEAKSLDEKLDDGMPLTGSILAHSDLMTVQSPALATSHVCTINTTTPPSYNVTDKWTSAENSTVCQLQLRVGF